MHENKDKIEERSPVVAVMGHIDHGKSTLLDYIRKSNQVEKEAGGITQHISAYEVSHKNKEGAEKKITFLDTPGHEAFKSMRSRGAKVADIAILVVAADDGVKAQTLEAYKAIEESKTPYIVAINKIDKPDANIEKVKQNLAENNIFLEGYGGHISFIPVSAKSGEGIDELLEMILLTAELEEFKGDKNKNAEGVIIEADRDPQKGIAAVMIIKDGSIKNGLFVVAEESFAPVRIMEDYSGKKISEASFSSPIKIIGFNKLPEVGSTFQTVNSKKEAEGLIEETKSGKSNSGTKENHPPAGGEKEEIPVVLKTDVVGSIEAVIHELKKLENDKISIKIVSSGTGNISENDVKLASGKSNTVIVGFNVKIDPAAKELREKFGLQMETFEIIYKLGLWFETIVAERTPVTKTDEVHGNIKVLKIFSKNKNKQIIGARLRTGEVSVGDKVRITRREVAIGEGKIVELQQSKMVVQKVSGENTEFGAKIDSPLEIAPGDIIDAFSTKLSK